MYTLTNKNYDALPEVKKRKEDEKKKNEMLERKERVKSLEKVYLNFVFNIFRQRN